MPTTASAPQPRQPRRPQTSFATCPVCGSRQMRPYRLRSIALDRNRAGCIDIDHRGVTRHDPGTDAATGGVIQLEMECDAGHQSWTIWRTTGTMTSVEVAGNAATGPVSPSLPADASPEERLLAVIRDKPTARLDPSDYHLLSDLRPLVGDAILSCGPDGCTVQRLRVVVDREILRRWRQHGIGVSTVDAWVSRTHEETERLVAIIADDLVYETHAHADSARGRYWMDANQASYQSADRDLRA